MENLSKVFQKNHLKDNRFNSLFATKKRKENRMKVFLVYIKEIITALGIIVPFVASFKKDIIGSSNRVIKGKYKDYETLKTIYSTDKHNGYFAFQNYLGMHIESNLIDYIMTSSEAYSIMNRLKSAEGKYTFDGKTFYTKISRAHYILPLLGYFTSSFLILFYIVMNDEIIKSINIRNYIYFLLIIVGIFGPILINSMQSIHTLNSAIYLEKLTQPKVTRKQKNKKRNMTKGGKNAK